MSTGREDYKNHASGVAITTSTCSEGCFVFFFNSNALLDGIVLRLLLERVETRREKSGRKQDEHAWSGPLSLTIYTYLYKHILDYFVVD